MSLDTRKNPILVWTFAFLSLMPTATWSETRSSGHVKFLPSFYSGIGDADPLYSLESRLNALRSASHVEVVSEGVLSSIDRSGIDLSAETGSEDARRVFDLTVVLDGEGSTQSQARLDRLSLGWKGERGMLRVGRQAISMGNGLLFQVLDPFNPFSPLAIDKEYKSGDDMVTGRVSLLEATDVQLAAIGRREEPYGGLTSAASSYVGKARVSDLPNASSLEFVGALHRDEWWYGLGGATSLGEAIVRTDLAVVSDTDRGGTASFLLNYDRGFEIGGRSAYALIEYFRSGFGVSRADYVVGSQDVRERIDRGELFTLGRHYLAVGGRVEMAPRTTTYLTVFQNLGDGSFVSQARLSQELTQEVIVGVGCTVPIGGTGDEFGTLSLPSGEGRDLPREVFVRVEWFWGR